MQAARACRLLVVGLALLAGPSRADDLPNPGHRPRAGTAARSSVAQGLFTVDQHGNLTKLNNVTTSFPSTQGGVGSFYRNNGSGAITWSPTLPAFRACGADSGGTGTVTPGLPAGHVTNDILLLFIQSANEAGTCPAGYTQVGPQPGTGTAAASAATRLTVCWKRDGGAESGPTVADSGNHTYAVICAFSGATTAGDPFHFLSSGVKATASTSTSITGGATTVDAALIVNVVAQGVSGTAGIYSAEANTSLASVTEQWDAGTTSGVGGGLAVITGTLVTAATVAATTATVTSTAEAFSTLALLPSDTTEPGKTPRACDVQSFTACGANPCPSDTWVKPSGAKTVDIIAIGGGGAGGAGIASTAAGGGGGGGGAYVRKTFQADQLSATETVTVGSGGVGGSTKSAAKASTVSDNSNTIVSAGFGVLGVDATSATGGAGSAGGSVGTLVAAAAGSPGTQGSGGVGGGGGTGGATGGIGGKADWGGGGGGGGKSATGAGAGGTSEYGGGGGGGGASTGTAGAGGVGCQGVAGGASQGGSATGSGVMTCGSSGGAGGAQTTTTGGNGAQPGGGGGGGGAAGTSGGNGAAGAVTIVSCF